MWAVPWEGAPAARGPRSTAKYYHAVLTLGSNVTTTTKKIKMKIKIKGRQLWGGGRKVHPREKKWLAYEKRAPAFRWYRSPPKWLIRPWSHFSHYLITDLQCYILHGVLTVGSHLQSVQSTISLSTTAVQALVLFANCCTYLGDQLTWAFAFLVARHCALYCFVLFNLCRLAQLATYIDRSD